jgi:hypothetical protein
MKHTGLSEEEIKSTSEQKQRRKINNSNKVSIRLIDEVEREEEPTLKQLIETAVDIKEGIISMFDCGETHFFPCKGNGKVYEKDLAKTFDLTIEQVQKNVRLVKFKLGSRVGKGLKGEHMRSVTFLRHSLPNEEQLVFIVSRIRELQKRIFTSQPTSTDDLERSYQGTYDATHQFDIYTSRKGQMYLNFVNKEIARGGYKTVSLGYDVNKRNKVAFAIPCENGQYTVVKNEFKLLERAQGPGVCRYHTCFEIKNEGKLQLGGILHYYNGGTLNSSLSELQKLPLAESLPSKMLIVNKLAGGLARMHSEDVNVIHGDIKPANILLTKDHKGNVKDAVFADFGFACLGENNSSDFSGTYKYASPFQLENGGRRRIDDIWSLGISLYQIIKPYKDIPRFNEIEKLISLFGKNPLDPSNDQRTKFELKQKFINEAKANFNTQRPVTVSFDEEMSTEEKYILIQSKLEILFWDMLFSNPRITAVDVFQRAQAIQQEFNQIIT